MAYDRQYDCAGAPTCRRRKRGKKNQVLGRPCGGAGTKIPLLSDALVNPIRVILTGGEQADCFQALLLLKGMTTSAVLAAKGYDAGYIADVASAMGAETVIPPVRHRRTLGNMTSFCITSAMLLKKHLGK